MIPTKIVIFHTQSNHAIEQEIGELFATAIWDICCCLSADAPAAFITKKPPIFDLIISVVLFSPSLVYPPDLIPEIMAGFWTRQILEWLLQTHQKSV